MKVYPRSAWTNRQYRNRVPLNFSDVKHIVVHWPGSKGKLNPAKTAAYLKGWQTYHMDSRGWTDIAYNEAVDQNGDVWILRGDYKDGATSGYGGRSYSILTVLGEGDTPSKAMLDTLTARIAKQKARAASGAKVQGHRELVQTDCPGDKIQAFLKGVKPVPPTPPKPVDPKAFPLPPGWYFGPKDGPKESVSGYFDTRSDGKKGHDGLLRAQAQLKALKLLKGDPDGLYGSDTEQATKALQKQHKLSDDGLIGRDTWGKLWAPATNPPVPPKPTPKPEEPVNEITVAEINWLDPRFGGSRDYQTRADYMKNTAKADVYIWTETNEDMRNAFRKTLGGMDRSLVYPAPGGSVAVGFDSEKFPKYERVGTKAYGSGYHGGVATKLDDIVFVATHTRPRASFKSDAASKAGKATDVRRAFELAAKHKYAVVGGDFNLNADAIAKEFGFTRLTPKVDSMPKVSGDQYFDALYGKNVKASGATVLTPPKTDHKGMRVKIRKA